MNQDRTSVFAMLAVVVTLFVLQAVLWLYCLCHCPPWPLDPALRCRVAGMGMRNLSQGLA
jgi:hypothetical protein